MKPDTLHTKLFLDGGVPSETREVASLLGFLDGQTTNPSLIAKHPAFQAHGTRGEKLSEEDAWNLYRTIVEEISLIVPQGSVSIEVYADSTTRAEAMIAQGLQVWEWIPNAHIKLPTTHEGLRAAEALVSKGVRVNMTLCFSQAQAAAVYGATRGAKKGDVFLSPFVGRLDDIGQNGMGFIGNVLRMFQQGDGHVEVLVASVRSQEHFTEGLRLGADIITAPASVLTAWVENGMPVPKETDTYDTHGLQDIPYETHDLTRDWSEFDIDHELTTKGIERFVADWKAVVAMPRG